MNIRRRWWFPAVLVAAYLLSMFVASCAPKPKTLEQVNAEDDLWHTHSKAPSVAVLFPATIEDGFMICLEAHQPNTEEIPPACRTLGELRRVLFGEQKWAD